MAGKASGRKTAEPSRRGARLSGPVCGNVTRADNQVVGDFTIVDREYPHLPDLLISEAPAFGESEEFRRLEPADLTLPSVVAGAFGRYVERLFSASVVGDSPRVRAVSALERLATSPDPEVRNTLVVEVFEHLDLPEKRLADFLSELGPAARALYDPVDRARVNQSHH